MQFLIPTIRFLHSPTDLIICVSRQSITYALPETLRQSHPLGQREGHRLLGKFLAKHNEAII